MGTLLDIRLFYILILPFVFSSSASAQNETKVIILGTGTPDPVLNRSGSGVAIVTGDNTYVFDAGGGMAKMVAIADIQCSPYLFKVATLFGETW